MGVPLSLLGLLEREPAHGYDLKRDYDAWFGQGKPLRDSDQEVIVRDRTVRSLTAAAPSPGQAV